MSKLLKDIYSIDFFNHFSITLEEVVPAFDKEKFIENIFDKNWESKELKERMRHTSEVLNLFFPSNFSETATLIKKIIEALRQKNVKEGALEFMFLPDYIETYGINDYDSAVSLIEFVTQFTSCEFAVRQFIVKYGDKMLKQMQERSTHNSPHVRRLASEGSRPRLPWAIALPPLKDNPTPILPILENLKNDPSEYVRRSVANSLNDISKDNPDILISIAKKWRGQNKATNTIIKHAARTLLKQGNLVILNYFGFMEHTAILTENFNLHNQIVEVGSDLEFSFSIHNNNNNPIAVRLEYGIYYLRNNGQHSKKVFKISERQLNPLQKIDISRKQSFKIISTRRFYIGHHKISLIINGKEKQIKNFELIANKN